MSGLSRRGLLGGLGALLVAAPAIVRASSLMPVKALPPELLKWTPELLTRDWTPAYTFQVVVKVHRHSTGELEIPNWVIVPA